MKYKFVLLLLFFMQFTGCHNTRLDYQPIADYGAAHLEYFIVTRELDPEVELSGSKIHVLNRGMKFYPVYFNDNGLFYARKGYEKTSGIYINHSKKSFDWWLYIGKDFKQNEKINVQPAQSIQYRVVAPVVVGLHDKRHLREGEIYKFYRFKENLMNYIKFKALTSGG